MERLTREGVALAFEDVGKGAPPILLIHDLGRDHTSLQPQLEHFRRRHRVVAVDLSGHGQSDRLVQLYTLTDHAEDLVWLCYELGVYCPVAVGQGVGGMIAVELAARWPDLLAAVVALDGLPARQWAANARAQGSAQPEVAVVAIANQDALWEHAMTPISPAAGHFLALRTAAVGRGSAGAGSALAEPEMDAGVHRNDGRAPCRGRACPSAEIQLRFSRRSAKLSIIDHEGRSRPAIGPYLTGGANGTKQS